MEDNSTPKIIAFAYRERITATICAIGTLVLCWLAEMWVFGFISIDNAIIYHAVKIALMLGVFYVTFSLLNRMDFLNKAGRCAIYPDGRVRLRMGRRQYRFDSVSEVFGDTSSLFVFDTFPILKVSSGGDKVQINGCPEKGKNDFGEMALYQLFLALVESNDRLQPVRDIWGDETEYWYAVHKAEE